MRTRIVYYSRNGTTRLLAEALAARLVADVSEIQCGAYGLGLFGYLRAGRDAMRKARPAIRVDPPAEPVDCLLIGTPIWAGMPAAPVQSYLAAQPSLPERVGVFITSGGPPPHPKAQAEIGRLLARAPDAWLMMRDTDVKRGAHSDEIGEFIRELALRRGAAHP
jgi:hypothetical protein